MSRRVRCVRIGAGAHSSACAPEKPPLSGPFLRRRWDRPPVQDVAVARHRADVQRRRRRRLDLRAQVLHVPAHHGRIATACRVTPYAFEKLPAREHLAGVCHEKADERELGRRDEDRRAVHLESLG